MKVKKNYVDAQNYFYIALCCNWIFYNSWLQIILTIPLLPTARRPCGFHATAPSRRHPVLHNPVSLYHLQVSSLVTHVPNHLLTAGTWGTKGRNPSFYRWELVVTTAALTPLLARGAHWANFPAPGWCKRRLSYGPIAKTWPANHDLGSVN